MSPRRPPGRRSLLAHSLARRPPRRRGFQSEGWAESLARARAFATFLHFLFHRPPKRREEGKGKKNVDRDEGVEEVKLGVRAGKSGEGENKWWKMGWKPPQTVIPAGGDRGWGGRVGVGERERVAGQETSSADEVIGLKIKRWRHLKPIPVNELSGARGERRRQARAGRGAGAPGGAAHRPPLSARPREAAAREAPGGGRGSRSRPTDRRSAPRQSPAARAGRSPAVSAACCARARFSSLRVRGPRARVRSPPARSRGCRSLNPPRSCNEITVIRVWGRRLIRRFWNPKSRALLLRGKSQVL